MRRFILKRQWITPFCYWPNGTIGEQRDEHVCFTAVNGACQCFHISVVEENKEWFAELDVKRWTDSDMIMFLRHYAEKWNDENKGLTTLQCLEDFKKSGL